jgi:hypothetical protein
MWYEKMIVAVHALEGFDNIWKRFYRRYEVLFGVVEKLSGLRCLKTWTGYGTTDLDRLLKSLEIEILFM